MSERLLRLLALLQYADGLFPSGGFAHSFGLETYTQAGVVTDRAGVGDFLRAQLEQSAGPADAVAAASACRFAAGDDVDACAAVDRRLDAMKWVPELRAASTQMGRQTLRVATADGADPVLAKLGDLVDREETPGHHAVVFGAALGRAGLDGEAVAAAYLYATAALLVNAALRLLPLGQVAGQRLLADIRPAIARLARAAARAAPDAMWSFAPGLELAALRHATLEARMFRS
jgi:urease accessory protein